MHRPGSATTPCCKLKTSRVFISFLLLLIRRFHLCLSIRLSFACSEGALAATAAAAAALRCSFSLISVLSVIAMVCLWCFLFCVILALLLLCYSCGS